MTAKNVKAASRVKAKKAPLAATVPAIVNKSRTIQVPVKPDETYDRAVAGMVARGIVTNASTVIRFESHDFEGLSLMDMAGELRAQGEAVNGGDLSSLERTLTAQALSLNAIFGELARIAHCNLFKVPDVAERYLRLALKAQGQSRATVETLAAIKNPPVVFAKQANINNGGQQQVNNGATQVVAGVRGLVAPIAETALDSTKGYLPVTAEKQSVEVRRKSAAESGTERPKGATECTARSAALITP